MIAATSTLQSLVNKLPILCLLHLLDLKYKMQRASPIWIFGTLPILERILDWCALLFKQAQEQNARQNSVVWPLHHAIMAWWKRKTWWKGKTWRTQTKKTFWFRNEIKIGVFWGRLIMWLCLTWETPIFGLCKKVSVDYMRGLHLGGRWVPTC